ncbi:MAG: penicillin-binding protein 2 [Alphaproteobacteria bacterium]|nr:penicillin-binding protein 2 [Alphaproteobacteria bacterium]
MPLFDRKDKSRYNVFTRRSLVVGGGMAAVFATLAGRLYQLQIVEGQEFMTRAEDNRVSQRLLAPLRGLILDRFGVALADNRRNYRILVVKEQASDGVEAALDNLARIITLTPQDRERVLRQVRENRAFVPVTVIEDLNWEAFSRINLHLPYLPGIVPDVGETRSYPFGAEMSHIIGYVAAVSESDMKRDPDPVLSLPGFRIGKRGIEKQFDAEIRGTAGTDRVEVNAYGRVIRELSRDPGIPGDSVYLTIDQEVQDVLTRALGDQSAASVVMDVETGDVLALASTPGYDPNLFNVGITEAQWRALTTDDHDPLLNKAIGGVYPPGSTFKTAMALGGIEAGYGDLQVFCTGSLRLGDHVFHCWKHSGHGLMTVATALQQSCDVFFYTMAMKLGIDGIDACTHALGLGQPTGIELPGERAGLIPSRAWKRAALGRPWEEGETLVTGIGQGYVLATPVQLCTLAARIASGRAVVPRITRFVGHRPQPRVLAPPLPFSQSALATVREGMRMAVNELGGTAYARRITETGYEMAGKTGTAQVRRITAAERARGDTKTNGLPWKYQEHALFIAFAPVGAPKYACAVVIEHGAAIEPFQVQVAHDALLFTQQRDPVRLPTAYPVATGDLRRTYALK